MVAKILCVDDDALTLEAYNRLLRKTFDLHTALNGESGLESIGKKGPFAVVVTDMNMPGMNGTDFLARVRQLAPDSVRIMLTGMADQKVAVDAVNQGHIFQFLQKPVDNQALLNALTQGVIQYRLQSSEKDLLERTLTGSIKVLVNILEMVNPLAFSRAMRIKGIVNQIAQMKKLENQWQYEVAALLSHIGCVILPSELLEKMTGKNTLTADDQAKIKSFPEVGQTLIASIPRMEAVAAMVGQQQSLYVNFPGNGHRENPSALGAQMLKMAIDYDVLRSRGDLHLPACDALAERPGWYNPDFLRCLRTIQTPAFEPISQVVKACDLQEGMVLVDDVRTNKGMLMVVKGQEISGMLVKRLQNFVAQGTIPDLFNVKFYMSAA
jgi:response regulator RpfG family c-di-GMP phosphodiesterase